jgi:hypothetical protein
MLSPDYAGPITAAGTLEEVKKAAHFFDPASALTTVNQMAPSYSVSKAALNRCAHARAGAQARGLRRSGRGGSRLPALCDRRRQPSQGGGVPLTAGGF